jgi:hypothetical protein
MITYLTSRFARYTLASAITAVIVAASVWAKGKPEARTGADRLK